MNFMGTETFVIIGIFIFLIIFLLYIIVFGRNKDLEKKLPEKYKKARKLLDQGEKELAIITCFGALEEILKAENRKFNKSKPIDLINHISDKIHKRNMHYLRMDRNKIIHENYLIDQKTAEKHVDNFLKFARSLNYK